MFDISLYPLLFLGKNQNRRRDVARPLCTPLGFLRNIGVGFGVGSIFVAWYGAWMLRGGDFLCGDRVLGGFPIDLNTDAIFHTFPNSMSPHRTTSPTKLTLIQGVP